MTELETIKRARTYMEKLANGINPIDGTMVPEDDVINNVRLSRCFFFVADVLRQVIERKERHPAAAERKPKRLPLSVPFEKRAQFAYSDAPIPASEVAKRVNALVEEDNMKRLTYSGIVTWLTEIGMLEWADAPGGKRVKRPTPLGMENGISVEERLAAKGAYQVVLYDCAAQHFIVDNLDAILTAENMQAEMQHAPWTQEQDERLRALYERAMPTSEIAAELKRSTSAVRGRLKKLGCDPK